MERELTPPLCQRGIESTKGWADESAGKIEEPGCEEREKGDTAIDKAGDFFDKTQAKTDTAIDKVQEAAKKAVDKGSPNT